MKSTVVPLLRLPRSFPVADRVNLLFSAYYDFISSPLLQQYRDREILTGESIFIENLFFRNFLTFSFSYHSSM